MKTPQPCGTNAAYHRHRANGETPCTACKQAHTADQTRRNERRAADPTAADRAGHGKASTYVNYACRCTPCCEAGAQRQREYRMRRAAQ
ncbi:hypothetical protein [Streptomyces sp. NPDC056543]|uniref:hypothetical protein n=1 Tax=unclassified Streptomyces TaxID=2593676 RepID=UPI0036C2BDE4